MKKFKFTPGERSAGSPPTPAEIAWIENISEKWDGSKKLQEKYPNFYDYLAQSLREKEADHE